MRGNTVSNYLKIQERPAARLPEMQKRTSGTSAACVKFPSWCKNSGGERDNGWFKKLLCRESRNFGVNFLVLRSLYCIYFGL